MKYILILTILSLSGVLFTQYFSHTQNITSKEFSLHTDHETSSRDMLFSDSGFKTNTAVHAIPLVEVLDGGPGKDGIPSIDEPVFYSLSDALMSEDPYIDGIAVEIDGYAKFYPYSILVWHEIVNDSFGETPIVVTFCPLCASAIVFNSGIGIDSRQVLFGVSGKLWQSNLLMYDHETESLWSQALGKSVIGDKTGDTLEIIDSNVMTLEQFSKAYPDGLVLSRDTGHIKLYDRYPYGDYEETSDLIFPVTVDDTRFFSKELLYVVPFKDRSVALVKKDLLSQASAKVTTDAGTLFVTESDGIITATDADGEIYPGYHEMWFSWATHHGDDGVVWSKESE